MKLRTIPRSLAKRNDLRRTLALATLIGLPQPALADAADTSGDIIVTARKREEALQDVPLAVSVLGSVEITQRDIRNATELSASLPNLLTPRNPVLFSAPTFFIRGVGQGDHNWNTENGVAVFVDDVYLQSTSAAWIDMLDIERIEVLRGPQGTLYGRNSTSGAIKFVPSKPDPGTLTAYTEAVFGSHSRLDVKAGVNLPVADGTAALKLDAFRAGNHGFLTRVDTANQALDRNLAKEEGYGARLSALWRPSERFEFELTGSIVHRDNGMNVVTPIVPENFAQLTDPADLLGQILSNRSFRNVAQ